MYIVDYIDILRSRPVQPEMAETIKRMKDYMRRYRYSTSKKEEHVSGAYPIWPLPYDSKFASTDEEIARAPQGKEFCPRCTQAMEITPGDKTAMRRHTHGLKCKRMRELVAMNREGYHIMSTHGAGYWSESLRPYMRQEKHHTFYPATIVSFIRWKTESDGAERNGGKHFHKELVEYLALSEGEQIALLTGAILQHEYMMEDRNGVPFR